MLQSIKFCTRGLGSWVLLTSWGQCQAPTANQPRCAAATTCMQTAEMMHCKDLLPLIRAWNTALRELWNNDALPDGVVFWGLDIIAMFPNLSRDRVWESIQEMFRIVQQTRRGRGPLSFAINKLDRKLDRIGGGSPELFTNFRTQDVLDFVYYDIYCNDLFVYLNVVYRQVRGIAIGGTGSSQYACIDCMLSEYRYLETLPPYALQGPALLHPCVLPVRPGRFRDNCLGMKYVSTTFSELQSWMEGVYNLELQCEGMGDLWTTIQGEIQVIQGGPHGPPLLQLRLADKGTKFTEPHQRLVRYPDRFAPKAPRTLQSLVPAMAKNCAYYRDSRQDAHPNVQLVITDPQRKDYCSRWWVPSLRGCLDKWGLPMPDLPNPFTPECSSMHVPLCFRHVSAVSLCICLLIRSTMGNSLLVGSVQVSAQVSDALLMFHPKVVSVNAKLPVGEEYAPDSGTYTFTRMVGCVSSGPHPCSQKALSTAPCFS